MGKKVASKMFLVLTALVLASLACQSLGGGDTSSPTEESQFEPGVDATPVTGSDTTEEAPAETGGAYDGSWTGTNTVDDKEILFTVENNQVVSIALNYTGQAGDCDYHGAISASIDPVEISNDGFTVVFTGPNDEMTFVGTFTSESEANGTLLIKSPSSGLCGEYEKEVTWTASKGSDEEAEAEPTQDTSGMASDADSIALVNEFFDAVNSGNVDAALDLVDENVMFNVASPTAQFGRENLRAYFASNQGVTYQISDLQSLGGAIIQFKAEASDGTVYSYCQIFTQDGKITMLSFQP